MNSLQKCWALLVIPAAILAACAGEVYVQQQAERRAWAAPAEGAPGDGMEAPETVLDEDGDYSEVETGLYVGGLVRTPPPGTDAVLCLCEEKDPYRATVGKWNWQPIPDGGAAPSLEWLAKQVDFIAGERKAGKQVYVHCWAGISRGPMVTAAYLMWEHHWPRDKALDFLHEQRPIVSPNIFFMDLLLDWEDELKVAATRPGGANAGTGQANLDTIPRAESDQGTGARHGQ